MPRLASASGVFLAWNREYSSGRGKPRHGVAEASRGMAWHPQRTATRNIEVFQFLPSATCSIHTAHEERNSSGLPHFDLPATDGSDRGTVWGMWLSLLCCHTSQGEAAAPRFGLPLPQVYSPASDMVSVVKFHEESIGKVAGTFRCLLPLKILVWCPAIHPGTTCSEFPSYTFVTTWKYGPNNVSLLLLPYHPSRKYVINNFDQINAR